MYRLLVLMLISLFAVLLVGCGGKKYQVDYHGQKDFFEGAEDSYAAGTKVKLVFGTIATDTDYSFFVDGKSVNPEWKNEAYVISFTMPDHDIEVYYSSVNSMTHVIEYAETDPDDIPETLPNTSVSDAGLEIMIDSCAKTIATVGGDGYSEYVLYKRDESTYELHYYSKYAYMDAEVHYAYQCDKSILDEAYKKIDALELDSFEGYRGIGRTGGDQVLKYRRGDKLLRLSLDNMPEDKQSLLYEIDQIIRKAATEENRLD